MRRGTRRAAARRSERVRDRPGRRDRRLEVHVVLAGDPHDLGRVGDVVQAGVELGEPTGGRSLVEGSIEARFDTGLFDDSLQVVGFVDAGQVYESTTPEFSDLRFGAGIGGRFYTYFGPVRLDIATPLGRKADEGRFNVYVSIGQAF